MSFTLRGERALTDYPRPAFNGYEVRVLRPIGVRQVVGDRLMEDRRGHADLSAGFVRSGARVGKRRARTALPGTRGAGRPGRMGRVWRGSMAQGAKWGLGPRPNVRLERTEWKWQTTTSSV